MARLSFPMLCTAVLCAVLAAPALAVAPPTKQNGATKQAGATAGSTSPSYIVCAQGLNHCCCNRLPTFNVVAHPGPVTAEPTRNFFIDGNGQQYTCSESSCQCVPRYGYHGPTARQASH
jgi:hypothetical protein